MSHVHRFYCPDLAPRLAAADGPREITLSEEETHHALHVVRIRSGEAVMLFDGSGGEAPGEVCFTGKREVRVLAGSLRTEPAPAVRLTLVQAWLLREKSVEYVIQHGTELGVTRFLFFRARHSEKAPKDSEKWRRLAIETCKQCGRLWLPDFDTAPALDAALAQVSGTIAIATQDAVPAAVGRIVERAKTPDGVELALIVGPEGDFTEEEITCARDRKALPISLGAATYRSEIAATLASALLLYECGALGPLPEESR